MSELDEIAELPEIRTNRGLRIQLLGESSSSPSSSVSIQASFVGSTLLTTSTRRPARTLVGRLPNTFGAH